jgi:signal transduction histidine kinase
MVSSTSVRLSLVFAVLISAAFLVAALTIRLVAAHSAEAEIREQLQLEADAIGAEAQGEGLEAAIAAIATRAERPGALEYWLTDARGARLAGDQPGLDGPQGFRRIDLPSDAGGKDAGDQLMVLTTSLPGGDRLSVAEELGRVQAVQNAILRTFGSIGGLTVIVCLIFGVLLTRRALAGFKALTATVKQVAAGDLGARYRLARPRAGSGRVDIDEVGAGLDAMLDRVEALVDGLRRVSRDVAHDLRTPLTHLGQRLEQAMSEESPDARAEALLRAQSKAQEMMRIFDAILRLGEIEAGESRRRFASVDLAALVEGVVDAYRPDVEDGGRRLEVVRLDPCTVQGDRDMLAQALANLIENAHRHTPPGTRITVAAIATSGSPRIEVIDDGQGIPDSDRMLVLEPFARLDESRSTPGSGLGLSIVAAVAAHHGAALELSDARPGLRAALRFAG